MAAPAHGATVGRSTVEFRPCSRNSRRRRRHARRRWTRRGAPRWPSCDVAAVEELAVVPTTTGAPRRDECVVFPDRVGRLARYYLGPAGVTSRRPRRGPSSSPARAGRSSSTLTGPGCEAWDAPRPSSSSTSRWRSSHRGLTWWRRRSSSPTTDLLVVRRHGRDQRRASPGRRPGPWRPRPGSPTGR